MNLLFAWRYFRSKKTTNAINIIAWISVTAIAVGAAALIIVLSVFNGFEDLVQGLYKDFYADMRIAPAQGKVIKLTPTQIDQLKGTAGVATLSLVAEEKALLVNGEYQSVVFLKGVDENYLSTNGIGGHIIRGKFKLGSAVAPELVLGGGIENAIGADVEKGQYPVTLYLPNRKAVSHSIENTLNSFNAMPSGTFIVQQDFDNKYAFSNLAFLKFMLDMQPDEYSSVELKLNNNKDAGKIKASLEKLLGSNYTVETRYQQNQSLYTVMEVEKWVIYAVLALIMVVASFNMIGALTMLVLEKQKDIAVLKAMGANDSSIQKIFLSEGFILAGIGGAGGILLAVIICLLQIKFKLIPLRGGSFIIDYYPVKLVATDFILVAATILLIALAAAWIPSRKACRQEFSLKS